MTPRAGSFVLGAFLFLISGALGLAYELVWIRQATLIVGASQIALSAVLTSFFLGLGLGNFVMGRRFPALARPLFLYGCFEVVIGVFALLFPWLFEGIHALYGLLYPAFAPSPVAVFLLRFALVFLPFLVPTFLMGGTLPLLLEGLAERGRVIGATTSFLYGVNILGAVAGVILTSYFLIPAIGIRSTSIAGGVGNLAIGAVAMAAFRRPRTHVRDAAVPPAGEPGYGAVLLGLSFASGLIAIGYQIAWARYFSLFNTGTVHFTAILLAVYLLALASGSLILAPLLVLRFTPLQVVAWSQPLVAMLSLYGLEAWRGAAYKLSMIGNTPELLQSHEVVASWHLVNETVDALFFAPLFQVGLSIFLPVLLAGMTLPALIAASTRSIGSVRRTAGTLLFANTLGGSAGSFLAGYVLLPIGGLTGTLVALALGSLLIGAVASWTAPIMPGRLARRGPFVLVLVAVASVAVFPLLRGDITRRTITRYGWGTSVPEDTLVGLEEGPLATAYVFDGAERRSIGSGNVCLAVVENHMPSTQAIQGHMPAIFYPGDGAPADCLGIGMGSGQSFGALLLHPVKRLDVVDISREMVDLSLAHFADYNHGLRDDPRVTVHLDDARHFIQRAADSSYDVVSMEPPPPTTEGAYTLYSLDFYESVRRILRTGGVLMQWLPLYRITPADLRGIVKTQAAIFPQTFVIKVGKVDFMVLSVALETPPRFSVDRLRERAAIFAQERLVAGSRWEPQCRHDIASLEGVLSLIVSGPQDIARLESPELYRDDDAQLSYSSGDRELLRRYEGPYLARISFAALPLTPFADLATYFDQPIPAPELDEERARSLAFFDVPDPTRLAAGVASFRDAADPVTRGSLALSIAGAYDGALDKTRAFAWLERALAANPSVDAPEYLAFARGIVRNRIAVFENQTREWIHRLESTYATAPLFQAMRTELQDHDAHEAKLRAGYLWQ